MRLLFLLLFLLSPACAPGPSPVQAGPPPASAGGAPILLGAWNVANFFDTVDDPNDDTVATAKAWKKKISQLSRVVSALDADFLAIEEVENLACLEALNAALEHPYPQIGLVEGNDTRRGIDVAFMSRLPVSRVVSHRDYDLPDAYGVRRGYKFSRDCLQVELATEPPVTVFVNHFKSQLGSKKDGAAKRRVQAEAVASIARSASSPGGVQVVLGDLNDRPGSWSLEPLSEDFLDVYEKWPEPMRASHRSKQGNTALDYIMVSRGSAARIAEARVWQGLGSGASDHDPVTVVLRLDQTPGAAQRRTWSQSDDLRK